MSELFNRDFSKPVFTIVETNSKTSCKQCNGKGKLKVIIGKSIRDAQCAQCDGSGAVDGIVKAVKEMYIRQIDAVYIVEGNRREVIYHLRNKLFRNGGVFTRKNSDDGLEVFETKKQADIVLREWLEGDNK